MSDDLIRHALSLIAAAARIGELVKKAHYHGHALPADAMLSSLAAATWEIAQIRGMIK